jgi:hypothetical protein
LENGFLQFSDAHKIAKELIFRFKDTEGKEGKEVKTLQLSSHMNVEECSPETTYHLAKRSREPSSKHKKENWNHNLEACKGVSLLDFPDVSCTFG